MNEQLLRQTIADLAIENFKLRQRLEVYEQMQGQGAELLFEGMTGLPPDRRRARGPDAEAIVVGVRGAGSG
jgi:hypothetical protein